MNDRSLERFACRSRWPSSLRAVLAYDQGLWWDRRYGGSRLLPWGDIVASRWLAHGDAELVTVNGRVRLPRTITDLPGLLALIDKRLARRQGRDGQVEVAASDVLRWLNGFTEATIDFSPEPSAGWSVYVGCAAAALVVLTIPLLGSSSAAVLPFVLLIWLGAGLLVVLSMASGRGGSSVTVVADEKGVRVSRGTEETRQFAWSEVVGVSEAGGQAVVRLARGGEARFAASPLTRPLIAALKLVVMRRQELATAGELVPDAALSPARLAEGPADRGLSPAEEVDV